MIILKEYYLKNKNHLIKPGDFFCTQKYSCLVFHYFNCLAYTFYLYKVHTRRILSHWRRYAALTGADMRLSLASLAQICGLAMGGCVSVPLNTHPIKGSISIISNDPFPTS